MQDFFVKCLTKFRWAANNASNNAKAGVVIKTKRRDAISLEDVFHSIRLKGGAASLGSLYRLPDECWCFQANEYEPLPHSPLRGLEGLFFSRRHFHFSHWAFYQAILSLFSVLKYPRTGT